MSAPVKTLGQVAFEASESTATTPKTWEEVTCIHVLWERAAQAVAEHVLSTSIYAGKGTIYQQAKDVGAAEERERLAKDLEKQLEDTPSPFMTGATQYALRGIVVWLRAGGKP